MQTRGDRSQSETLGVVLILGMTILSVGALVTFGASAIEGTQHSVDVQSAEHALSQLDSEVSLVALSKADRQTVPLGRGRQGSYSVRPDEGRITIIHHEYEPGESLVIYNDTMGQVRYETGDTVLAYQGGGVWRSQGGDGATMVSAPEFHYRSATLTLPMIRVRGDTSVSGSATADISKETSAVPIYPNKSSSYPDNGHNFTNPVSNGTLEIKVQSEFYRAWGAYFEERTDGEVAVYPSNDTATVKLISSGLIGDFNMPLDGQPLELRGLEDGHPLNELSFTIAPDQEDSQEFSGLTWSLWSKEGSKEFEISISLGSDKGCDAPVEAAVYYYNGTVEQGWYDDNVTQVECVDADGDGDTEARINVDLTSDELLTYEDVGQNDLTKFKGTYDFADSTTFDEHGDTVTWEQDGGKTFNETESTTFENVTNHYVSLMGTNVDLVVKDGAGEGKSKGSAGNVNERASSGYIESTSSGKYVTYLHISRNNITVTLE